MKWPTCFLIALLLAGPTSAAIEDEKSLQNRLAMVEKLINTSTTAHELDIDTSEPARALRQEAIVLYQRATREAEAGNAQSAHDLLDDAIQKLTAATRLTSRQRVENKRKNDLERRRQSVEALLQALDRVAHEKQQPQTFEETKRQIDGYIQSARELEARGRVDGALALMTQAYQIVRNQVETVRDGDTLVRSLDFKDIQEEYLYELDRNDTHMMLIDLLASGDKPEYTRKMIAGFIEQAQKSRHDAEAQQQKGNTDQAVELLENSTTNLIRAIRMAGVYIPGG